MCKFEDCWDNNNSRVCADKSITANITPEIGKTRPVVIIRPYKRNRQAVIVPFTTKPPQKESIYTAFMPSGSMPGILAKKECWALGDMPKTVSLDRLQRPLSGNKNLCVEYSAAILNNTKFIEILSALRKALSEFSPVLPDRGDTAGAGAVECPSPNLFEKKLKFCRNKI